MKKLTQKSTIKNSHYLSAGELAFNSLGIEVPSCDKCTKACAGCKMKFIQSLDLSI